MTDRTKERTAESGTQNALAAGSNGSYEQWNNDWKRASGTGSEAVYIGVLLLMAASVSDRLRRRERRQIE